jgi:DNA polymerase I-like protein with 3'-5' exonuclease and polymerase domains/transposase
MLTSEGVVLNGVLEDTQINAGLTNEFRSSFSLESCAEEAGVQSKKSSEIKDHITKSFGKDFGRNYMGEYWRLPADDSMAVEYASGDGVTTWQLWEHQQKRLDEQNLRRVHKVECDLIPVLNSMTMRGIRVDVDRLHRLRFVMNATLIKANEMIGDINVNSTSQILKFMEKEGVSGWPTTPTGRPSFTEEFLKTNEPGKKILAVRKAKRLLEAFIDPMIDKHIHKGRVHAQFNQMRGDQYGTVTGRLSSSNPNLQQVPKRDEEVGVLFRSIFVPDEGMVWGSADFSQCFAKGTKVSVPGGVKNIEDMRPGDLVYAHHPQKGLVLRPVTWSGKTGFKKTVRIKWRASSGRTGEVVATPDHKFYLTNGDIMDADTMNAIPSKPGAKFRLAHRVISLSRFVNNQDRSTRPCQMIVLTGEKSVQESRFIFNELHGYMPENVHHVDGNPFNNDPSNLEGVTDAQHRAEHRPNKVDPEEIIALLKTGMFKTEVADRLGCTVHAVEYWKQKLVPDLVNPRAAGHIDRSDVRYMLEKGMSRIDIAKALNCHYTTIAYHAKRIDETPRQIGRVAQNRKVEKSAIIEDVESGMSFAAISRKFGCSRKLVSMIKHECETNHIVYDIEEDVEQDVYCLAVEDAHNFFANELLSMNCEPRLLAHYANCKVLIDGYTKQPPVDAHTAVAQAAGIDRQSGKRLNQALLTGAGVKKAASMLGKPMGEALAIVEQYFQAMPEIKELQAKASSVMRRRGYVMSILGRRSRLEASGYEYKAVNRLLQCSNADMIKISMVRIDQMCREVGGIDMLNNVHDSLDFQYSPGNESAYKKALEMMCDFPEITVPIEVDEKSGPDWAWASYGEKSWREIMTAKGML